MVRLYPSLEISLRCPNCDAKGVTPAAARFLGMHIVANCSCSQCGEHFWYALPVGHASLYTIAVSSNGEKIFCPDQKGAWLAQDMYAALFSRPETNAPLERKVLQKETKPEAILLNCLDSCYGHVYTKLWNAGLLAEKYPHKALVVLLPEQMAWLAPVGVAELWLVAAPLSALKQLIAPLDAFIKQELARFKHVWLADGHPHLDHQQVSLEKLVKTKRFDLNAFSSIPLQLIFVLREDRFWHATPLEFRFYMFCIKTKLLPRFRGYFVRRQNRLVNSAANIIKKQLPEIRMLAVGLGRSGRLAAQIEDLRTNTITEATELAWCSVYAKSQLVIGVHGSNMLIPSTLSAGFINILPRHKIPHIAEDTVLPYGNRYSLFLGRYLDHFVSPALLAAHALSLLRDFPGVYHNAEQQP